MSIYESFQCQRAFYIVSVAHKNIRFTVAPYAMMLPITFSYLVVRWLSFRESRGDPQYRVAWVGMSLVALVEWFWMLWLKMTKVMDDLWCNMGAFVGLVLSNQEVQSWLLLNAWGRAMLTILLLFIQMHMTKLSSPFQCNSLKDGSAVMVDSQDIYCNLVHGEKLWWVLFEEVFKMPTITWVIS